MRVYTIGRKWDPNHQGMVKSTDGILVGSVRKNTELIGQYLTQLVRLMPQNTHLKGDNKMARPDGKIYDCPCDPCPRRSQCGREATECKAVKDYYNTGWYRKGMVGINLKPMKMRKK